MGPGYYQQPGPTTHSLEAMLGRMMESVTHLATAVSENNSRLAMLESQVMPNTGLENSQLGAGDTAVSAANSRGSHSGAFAARGRQVHIRLGGHPGTTVDGLDMSMATKDLKYLSKTQKAARAAILTIRNLTGVAQGQTWPEYVEGVPRLNTVTGDPYFDVHYAARAGAKDPVNVKLLDQVSQDIVEDVQALVSAFAKETWADFKRRFIAERDEEKKRIQARNERNSRWQLRRKQMSDEASGPDPETEESRDDWVARMAGLLGITEPKPEILKSLQVFEVIRPNWRSDEYNQILEELREIYAEKLTARQMQTQKYRVRHSGRSTDAPPAIAPYNFAINTTWFDEFKDAETHQALLHDWGTYPDPEGFGENPIADAEASQPELNDDERVGVEGEDDDTPVEELED
ncbi:hypothetical protein FKP32DRAFT_1613761 [Trametes sanguinea]|nr:hypothetical protein FKP32DRAFT_1613761 [Trametes sanguinea]